MATREGLWWAIALGPAAARISLIPPTPGGHVKATVEFRQTDQRPPGGAALKEMGSGGAVGQIAPQLSYRGDQDAGAIALVEAATEAVVPGGQPMVIGGSEGAGEATRRSLTGCGRLNRASQVTIVLTAEVA
jgi:hypothetical protein